jgi:hypothetical protein
MPLLTSADYPSIRALVDTGLTQEQLPDTTIALDVFLGAGQDAVLQRDPLAETRTGAQLDRARRAAMLFTAALLAPTVLQRSERDYTEGPGSEHVKYATGLDGAKRAAWLQAQAVAQLDAYLTVTEEEATGNTPPDLFATARPQRGCCAPLIGGCVVPPWDGW